MVEISPIEFYGETARGRKAWRNRVVPAYTAIAGLIEAELGAPNADGTMNGFTVKAYARQLTERKREAGEEDVKEKKIIALTGLAAALLTNARKVELETHDADNDGEVITYRFVKPVMPEPAPSRAGFWNRLRNALGLGE